jgi:hypothetical protein
MDLLFTRLNRNFDYNRKIGAVFLDVAAAFDAA